MKVCVCTVCNSYFSSKAKRPKCPRCGGWGKKVCEVENAREAAEKVKLLQAQRVANGEKGLQPWRLPGGTRSGSDFSCSVRATSKQQETISILGMHRELEEKRRRRPNGLTSFMRLMVCRFSMPPQWCAGRENCGFDTHATCAVCPDFPTTAIETCATS